MMNSSAEAVHPASLALLEDPGVRIEHEAVCNLLLKAGGRPGSAAGVVRFDRKMIQEHLALWPPSDLL